MVCDNERYETDIRKKSLKQCHRRVDLMRVTAINRHPEDIRVRTSLILRSERWIQGSYT